MVPARYSDDVASSNGDEADGGGNEGPHRDGQDCRSHGHDYVKNKEDLLDKIAARLFEDLEVPSHDSWQQGLFDFFSEFREAAIAHPTLAKLLASGRITIPAVFDILEGFFGEMTDDGVSLEEAIRVFYAALAYTIGFVLWEIPRVHLQPNEAYADQWTSLISQLDPGTFPILTGPAVHTATTVADISQFRWGLRRVLGYQATARP